MVATPMPDAAGELLDQVLNPLLDDFEASFSRGFELLEGGARALLSDQASQDLRRRLEQASGELQAARALRAAAPVPMALDMANINSWHALVMEVWSLSAAVRRLSPEQSSTDP